MMYLNKLFMFYKKTKISWSSSPTVWLGKIKISLTNYSAVINFNRLLDILPAGIEYSALRFINSIK